MAKLSISLLVFSLITIAHAQDDSRLESLKDSWLSARERALKPIDETYNSELQRLLQLYTKAGNLDMALKVKAQIDSLNVEGTKTDPPPLSGPPEHLVGPKWSDPQQGLTFIFNPDGTGTKERESAKVATAFKWVSDENGLVEISFGTVKFKQYFEVDSRRLAYLYKSKEREGKRSMTPE